ncbi:conserved hypothetical protein [Acinetobacter proteolyticus]|uniref:Uncharacterized protein n=1 Tax=Acinetobacter proteolyticus TaxID=1776741 RepID=A0A653K3J6_9GAMM|nr:hypothetical protein [Acinetobacter proteolyticus]VXA55326.1 conserved hypothetical protein [Acinetobacter proteolyticus]
MPSIQTENGKLVNPLASKLILNGNLNIEVLLKDPRVVTSKREFCSVNLANNYLSSRDKYGSPNDYLDYLRNNFTEVLIDSDKGVFLGSAVDSKLLVQVKKIIGANLLVEMHGIGIPKK